MLRWNGIADPEEVDGGAENVLLPRLPIELPLPARASAIAGVKAKVRATNRATREDLRRIGSPNVKTLAI